MQRFRPNPAILASMLLYFSLGAALQLSSPQQLSRPLSPQDAVDTVEIQQTLNYYGLVVDLRRFDLLQYVFTPDVTVNFNTPGLPILHGLNAVTTFMSKALQSVNSFHAQSTHYIDLSNKTKPTATTYNSAKFFGTGDRKGKVYSDWGRYKDELVKTAAGWRISSRTLVMIGSSGETSLVFPEQGLIATF